MKKITFSALVLLLCITFATAQERIIVADNYFEDTNNLAYQLLSSQSDKEIENQLNEFYKGGYSIKETGKHSFAVYGITANNIGTNVDHAKVQVDESKSVTKIAFYFVDSKGNAIPKKEIIEANARSFIKKFSDYSDLSIYKTLSQENLELVADQLSNVEKDQKKIEKQIASNLKDQKSLGKKLDESPDIINEILAEKQDLIAERDSTVKEDDFTKLLNKKEKKIAKVQRSTNKAQSKLERKEEEYEDLKVDLKNAKITVDEMKTILDQLKAENERIQKL